MDLIEVIDSAVKIGLGAFISGVATYLTLHKQKKHDRKLDLIHYRRKTVEAYSETIQLSGDLSNDIAHWINKEACLGDDGFRVDNTLIGETAKNICNQVSSARRLSCLIGDAKLRALSEEYWRNRNEFYKLLKSDDEVIYDDYKSLKNQADAMRAEIYDHISQTFFDIHR